MSGCEDRPPDPDWQAVKKIVRPYSNLSYLLSPCLLYKIVLVSILQVMRHYIGKKHGVLDRYVKETLAEVALIFYCEDVYLFIYFIREYS